MSLCILAKLLGSGVGIYLVTQKELTSVFIQAFFIGILPVWLEVAASALLKVEPSREPRFLIRVIDNWVDGFVFLLVPALWCHSLTQLTWPLLIFVLAGAYRLVKFVKKGLSQGDYFEGLPVTYTGYLWIVLVSLGSIPCYWIFLIVVSGLMNSSWIKMKAPTMKPLKIREIAQLSLQMGTQLYSLSRRPYWSREKLQRYQLRMLKKRLDEAKYLVPMYENKHLPDGKDIQSLGDWAKLPILTKDELLSCDVVRRINKNYPIDDLIVSKSSGSTGKALDVYYDVESFNLFILAGFRLYRMAFSYRPWHRQTYIYTSPYPLSSLLGLFPMTFISTLNPIPDTIQKLKENPPDLLVCYPSHLRSIAEQLSEADLKVIRPQVINVNSEMSTQAERNYLSQKFHSFVFDDYSSEELTRIASQCRHLSYHLFDDINYMEVVNDQGQAVPEGVVGNLIGTNLHNKGMPLIRYMQGDRGAIRSKNCPCGRNFRVLETLEGRRNDAFTLSSGETLSSGYLLDLTYGVFLNYPGSVSAFCLIQEQPDHWALEMVPGEKWSEDLKKTIVGSLISDLNRDQIRIEPRIVQTVTKTQSGKANPIISRVNHSRSK